MDTKICREYGGIMIRIGTCHTCQQCGSTDGCDQANG